LFALYDWYFADVDVCKRAHARRAHGALCGSIFVSGGVRSGEQPFQFGRFGDDDRTWAVRGSGRIVLAGGAS